MVKTKLEVLLGPKSVFGIQYTTGHGSEQAAREFAGMMIDALLQALRAAAASDAVFGAALAAAEATVPAALKKPAKRGRKKKGREVEGRLKGPNIQTTKRKTRTS